MFIDLIVILWVLYYLVIVIKVFKFGIDFFIKVVCVIMRLVFGEWSKV